MKRKEFLKTGLATGALMGSSVLASGSDTTIEDDGNDREDQKS